MTVSSLAAHRVVRACTDALTARAYADELAQKVRRCAGDDVVSLRHQAYRAWQDAEKAEKTVREIPVATILEAVQSVTRPPERTAQMTFEEVCAAVIRVDTGETAQAVAVDTNRAPNTVRGALANWRAGRGKVAERAKKLGMWPSGKAPDAV